ESVEHGIGSKAAVRTAIGHVRFTPESGHVQCKSPCLLMARSGLVHRGKHQGGPCPWSVSCTCLSSALLTNSTESIAAPSWMRNCSIASFIGGGGSFLSFFAG